MAPLRFRAWDKVSKKMFENVIVGGLEQTVPAWLDPERGEWVNLWGSNEDGVVMQSTGLKDKNGREIFEGDILRATAPRGPFDTDRYEGRVAYSDIMAMWEFIATKVPIDICPLKFASDPEVLGNIYENPELLEKA